MLMCIHVRATAPPLYAAAGKCIPTICFNKSGSPCIPAGTTHAPINTTNNGSTPIPGTLLSTTAVISPITQRPLPPPGNSGVNAIPIQQWCRDESMVHTRSSSVEATDAASPPKCRRSPPPQSPPQCCPPASRSHAKCDHDHCFTWPPSPRSPVIDSTAIGTSTKISGTPLVNAPPTPPKTPTPPPTKSARFSGPSPRPPRA